MKPEENLPGIPEDERNLMAIDPISWASLHAGKNKRLAFWVIAMLSVLFLSYIALVLIAPFF